MRANPADRVLFDRVERDDDALRKAYLQFLTRLSKAHLLVLRAASASLGTDFDEASWERFAREYELPVASTFARASGGGSFSFAKFLAGVGPLPPHPGGSRTKRGPRVLTGWTSHRLLLGAMTVARMNGGWPPRDRFDDAARKARARGLDVPLVDVLVRRLGIGYSDLRVAATQLAREIGEGRPPKGVAPTYQDADQVAEGLASAVELLGYRPSADEWDRDTRHLRRTGVRTESGIHRTFGSWQAAWDYVARLGLDPGVQRDPRPRYTDEGIIRGLWLVEDRLGFRPSPRDWTEAVRDLKVEVGPGVIPAKPTIYGHFSSWKEAWLAVDMLRAHEAS